MATRISLLFLFLSFGHLYAIDNPILENLLVEYKIDAQENILHVTETYTFENQTTIPSWSRSVFSRNAPGRYPLLQRVENIVLTANGQEQTLETYRYGQERTFIYYNSPNLSTKSCTLRYDVYYPLQGNQLILEPVFYDFPFPSKTAEFKLLLPNGTSLGQHTMEAFFYDYTRDEENNFGSSNDLQLVKKGETNTYYTYFSVDNFEGYNTMSEFSLEMSMHFDNLNIKAPTTYVEEWQQQAGILPIIAIIALLLAIILRFMPTVVTLWGIRVYGLLVIGLSMYYSSGFFGFFWHLPKDVNQYAWENFFMEFGVTLMFWSIYLVIAAFIELNLRKRNSVAYYSVTAFPMLIITVAMYYTVTPATLWLLPIAFAPLIFWFKPQNATYFGVHYYKLVELVETNGQLSFSELAKHADLTVDRPIQIIQEIPQHPIFIDHDQKKFVSASSLALQKDYHLCNNCGAATNIANEDLLVCGYCHTEYRQSRKKEIKKPIPALVEVAALNIMSFAFLFVLMLVVFVIVVIVGGFFDGFSEFASDLFLLAVVAVLFGGIAAALMGGAESLKEGKGKLAAYVVFGLLSPLLTPIYILYKLTSDKRIQLHFGDLKIANIKTYIKKHQQVNLEEFATFLGVSTNVALEYAHYLCGNNQIAAVFDVSKQQLVHRDAWKQLSGENSCTHCGGLVGIEQGKVVCMHCGKDA
ncbi:MAG: hypothetical protein GY810_12675 [Aureispira sp.]|nr:hypothetical protein [Aureispira sp.]